MIFRRVVETRHGFSITWNNWSGAVVHDPWVREYQGDLEERVQGDALIVMVTHDEYRTVNLKFYENE